MAKRYLMWILFSFIFGLFLFTLIPAKWVLISSAASFLALVLLAFLRFPLRKLLLPCFAAFMVASAYYGFVEYQFSKIIDETVGKTAEVSGTIIECGKNSAQTQNRYTVKLATLNSKKLPFYIDASIYLYTDYCNTIEPGATFNGVLEFYDTPIDFGYGKENHILVSAFSSDLSEKINTPDSDSFYYNLHRFRTAVQKRLSFGSEKTNGFLHSICFGNKENLDSALNVSLKRCGLSHVTAVSGLHLSFAVLLFNLLLSLFGLHYRIRHLLNIIIAILFTALVGFPPSCIRACVMLSLFSLGVALNLFSDGLTSLSVAAFLICVFSPMSVRDVGFLLSVSATAGILVLFAPIENFLFPKRISKNHIVNWFYRKMTGVIACSVSATIATLPIVIILFGSVSVIGPLANMVLIFPIQGLFMLGILGILLCWGTEMNSAFTFVCDSIYRLIENVAKPFGRLKIASISYLDWFSILFLVLLAVVFVVSLYHYIRYRARSFCVLFVSLVLLFSTIGAFRVTTAPAVKWKIAFIDVGQGDCTVVSRGHHAIILDYGGSSESRSNLIDYLRRNNIYIVDLLAFTHLHDDHTNGFPALLQNVYVDSIIYPCVSDGSPSFISLIRRENSSIIDSNKRISVLNGASITVIADALLSNDLRKTNEKCVCYRIDIGEVSVLVTGDLEGQSEMNLLDHDLDCTILKVSHHGSEDSSVYPFIKAASPLIAVISVGENTYGLPDAEAVARLETICSTVESTLEGTVVYQTDGISLERINK